MGVLDRSWIDKAHAVHKRQHPVVRGTVVAAVGGPLVLAGVAMLVLPGPGLLVIAAGIAVLALEFPWARRALERGRDGFRAARTLLSRRR